jgi:peptidoglycan/LPS O-acetylase OafA/YrhL
MLRGCIWLFAFSGEMSIAGGRADSLWRWMIYYPTWTRLDGLLAGVVLALVNSFRPAAWKLLMQRANILLVAACGILTIAIYLFRDEQQLLPSIVGFPILALAMGCLVIAGASPASLIGRFTVPGAGFLAAMAYSLYLTHKAVYHLVGLAAGNALLGRPLLALAAYGGAALLVGALFYAAIERPSLRLRERVLNPRRPAPPMLVAERVA